MDMMVAMRDEAPTMADVPVERQYTSLNLDYLLDEGKLFGFIADGRGCIIGLLSANWYDPRLKAYEQMLYVSPKHRGSLLAARLVSRFIAEAKARGAVELHAGSSTGIDDDLTVELYQRFGFERCGYPLRMPAHV